MKKVLRHQKIGSILLTAAFILGSFISVYAQCGKFSDSPQGGEAETAHVLYRDLLKRKQYDDAFPHWEKAYTIAPAADGKRASHFADGITLYKEKWKAETDDAKKKEYVTIILRLYDEQMECYGNDIFLLGRKGYDMYYEFQSPYDQTYKTLKTAIDKGGNEVEYIVLEPLANILVYNYQKDKVGQQETQDMYTRLTEIADYNIKNNEKFGSYFESTKARMAAKFAEIEDEVFDCEYFKKKLLPSYQENPDDIEVIKYVWNKLKTQGCDESDPALVDLKGKYQLLAAEINAQLEEGKRQKNPGYYAAILQKEGKYREALAKYQEAIEKEQAGENRSDALSQFYNSMAHMQAWNLNQYNAALSNARKAANLNPSWGKPHIIIGDVYAKMSQRCGDDWDKRIAILAAIEKYAHARSIDEEVKTEANKKISTFSASRPLRQDGFMRGIKAGQKVKANCLGGVSVTMRFSD